MEKTPTTTIRKMMTGNKIKVPDYQRAYSWDAEDRYKGDRRAKQVETYLEDIRNHISSGTTSSYYLGHFLFEQLSEDLFAIIDGQQRLTTTIICLASLFKRLDSLGCEDESLKFIKEDIIMRGSEIWFSTVEYDNQFFRDIVIKDVPKEPKSVSAGRIKSALNYFDAQFSELRLEDVKEIIKTIAEASCTANQVNDKIQAIQTFLFQNNRGKRPTKLEVLKAEFMFHLHSELGDEAGNAIEEIQARFSEIHQCLSKIENLFDEDDVLFFAQKVYFNSLVMRSDEDRISPRLAEDSCVNFIKDFTLHLSSHFSFLDKLSNELRDKFEGVDALLSLRSQAIAIPILLKVNQQLNCEDEGVDDLSMALSNIVLRQSLIGTRADLADRLNDDFKDNDFSIGKIISRIDWMKTITQEDDNYYWGHWGESRLRDSIQHSVSGASARFILWRYENYLLKENNIRGYGFRKFEDIDSPELEHIAPKTLKDGDSLAAGYPKYDEYFIENHLDSLGNYLLLSKSHNAAIGNIPFRDKRVTYTYLEQQREIQELTENHPNEWTLDNIKSRREKLIDFIVSKL